MWTVLYLNIIVVFIAYLAKYKQFKYGLEVSFILICGFLSLRYNFGNDYQSYLSIFNHLNYFSIADYSEGGEPVEKGWILLNRVFHSFGFFALVISLSIFHCFVYYHFIKKYLDKNQYWLAVFFYTFNPDFMLLQSSMMRQSLAMSIVILSLKFILERKIFFYFICVYIASLFHQSALCMLPVGLLGYLNLKINKVNALIIVGLFSLLFFFKNTLSSSIFLLISAQFPKYMQYTQTSSEIGSGVGVVYQVFIMFLLLMYLNGLPKDKTLFFKLSILSYFVIPFSLMVMLIARIGYYFSIINIISFPVLIYKIEKQYYRRIFLCIMFLFTLYSFYLFFNDSVYKVFFSSYQTIFSAPQWY